MKYSYTWLKELSQTKLSPEKLADLLTMRAFELEEMKKEGKETQLVFDVLANRGHDMLSHLGMAREICAVEGRNFSNLRPGLRGALRPGLRKGLSIELKDKKLCRRYIGAVLENVKISPAPKWMQERLLVSGVKPINNIVDITNYVMLETGQPLHAFDANKTTENIIVRKAKKGEKIKLLDESEKILGENDLVIADSEKSLALAGIMGGLKSSVTKNTTKIVLESANFDPMNIRKTRVEHDLSTESSYRFEREIDQNLAEMGAARAMELLQKYGGSNVKLVAYGDMYPNKLKPWEIKLDINYTNSLLGENVPVSKIKNILTNLDLGVVQKGKDLIVKIPTFRLDLKTQEDLIEEIGRIYGYENIPVKSPVIELTSPIVNEKRIFENKLRDAMTALGFSEMLNYSFYSAGDIERCDLDVKTHLEVANPMNPDQQFMRTSLIPGILKNVELNLKNFDRFSIFEIGRIYFNPNQKIPDEKNILAGALVNQENKKNIFFKLRGKIETFFRRLGIENIEFSEPKIIGSIVHPTRTAVIKSKDKIIGYFGEINPRVLNEYKIKTRVAVFELNIEEVSNIASFQKVYKPISKFPSVRRDISMFIGEKTKYAEIESKIRAAGGKMLMDVELFDIFEKEGEKSLALRLEIGSREKTLTSEEIDGVMKKIIAKLEEDLKVKVRK